MLRLTLVTFALSATLVAQTTLPALPSGGPHSESYRTALVELNEQLRAAAPPVSEREERECLSWMRAANPQAVRTLVGHRVIVLATEGFAKSAEASEFLRYADLGYCVLAHLWGVDPVARVGRRVVIWPDPAMERGHRCVGAELRVHVGRADWDNAQWFERYFHEFTHGFQVEHRAGHLMLGGFYEGWAEFMQAAVVEHLAPLNSSFEARSEHYASHLPAAAQREYLDTRLPIEEIVAYDPAAGLLMELVNSTAKSPRGPRDWGAIRALLQSPASADRATPWRLWPARMANDLSAAFGAERARPILARYRFPLDDASLAAARASTSSAETTPRRPAAARWSVLGPFPKRADDGLELDPFNAADLAWRWARTPDESVAPALDVERAGTWRSVAPDGNGNVPLASAEGEPAYFYLAATLPAELRTRLTLFIASDDDCAVWLDGELVHHFRGERGCTPSHPDVAYADATSSRGQLVALVANRNGASAFSLMAAVGGLLFEGFEQRSTAKLASERTAAVAYLGSRRHQQPVRALLERAARDSDSPLRREALTWSSVAKTGALREAEDAYFYGSVRGGYFGNNRGASGGQCVARNWGGDARNWLALPLVVAKPGAQRVSVRYATPYDGSLRVRVRSGDRVLFVSGALRLAPSGADWNSWKELDVTTGELEPGVVYVELFEPAGAPDIDWIALEAR